MTPGVLWCTCERTYVLDTPRRPISREEFAHELQAKAGLEWDAHFSRYFADGCVCEWESLPVLCMPDDTHWIREYGRSYWAPPGGSGGKDTGDQFHSFMDPDGKYAENFEWLIATTDGLAQVDTDNNGMRPPYCNHRYYSRIIHDDIL